eukprot:SAG31_NODE_4030_length_3649_cov_3.035493_3_plen_167_part_00
MTLSICVILTFNFRCLQRSPGETVVFDVQGSSEIHLTGMRFTRLESDEDETEEDEGTTAAEVAGAAGAGAAAEEPAATRKEADVSGTKKKRQQTDQQTDARKSQKVVSKSAASTKDANATKAQRIEKQTANRSANSVPDFDPARKFQGARSGCVFKKGHLGIGCKR